MVFVQVELKHTGQVQDLIAFLLSRSYNNFRVTEQDLIVSDYSGSSSSANVPWTRCKTSPMATMESMHGDCPTLPEAATDSMLITPVCSSPLVDRKPVTVEIIDDDENDLSIENPTESEEKPSDFSNNGGSINRKRKWSTANELESFGSMKQLNLNIAILKRRKVMTNSALCAICEKQVQTTPRCLALHVGTKHMDLRSYRCAICQYAASIKGNVIKHIRHHSKTEVGSDFIEANLITIPFTKQQCDKIKELIEACFAVKTSERV